MDSRRMEHNKHGVGRLNLNASLRVILELDLCQTKRVETSGSFQGHKYIEFHDKKNCTVE